MFQTVRFIQMMSLTFGLFTQVSGSGPLGPLVLFLYQFYKNCNKFYDQTLSISYSGLSQQFFAGTF